MEFSMVFTAKPFYLKRFGVVRMMTVSFSPADRTRLFFNFARFYGILEYCIAFSLNRATRPLHSVSGNNFIAIFPVILALTHSAPSKIFPVILALICSPFWVFIPLAISSFSIRFDKFGIFNFRSMIACQRLFTQARFAKGAIGSFCYFAKVFNRFKLTTGFTNTFFHVNILAPFNHEVK